MFRGSRVIYQGLHLIPSSVVFLITLVEFSNLHFDSLGYSVAGGLSFSTSVFLESMAIEYSLEKRIMISRNWE